jgi:hypothetical protein
VNARGELVVMNHLGEQAELLVQLGQLEVDLDLIRIRALDSLENRDGLRVEALRGEGGSDAPVLGEALRAIPHPLAQLADLQADAGVVGIRLENLLVVPERLVGVPLGDVLLGRLQELGLVDARHAVPFRGDESRRHAWMEDPPAIPQPGAGGGIALRPGGGGTGPRPWALGRTGRTGRDTRFRLIGRSLFELERGKPYGARKVRRRSPQAFSRRIARSPTRPSR